MVEQSASESENESESESDGSDCSEEAAAAAAAAAAERTHPAAEEERTRKVAEEAASQWAENEVKTANMCVDCGDLLTRTEAMVYLFETTSLALFWCGPHCESLLDAWLLASGEVRCILCEQSHNYMRDKL